jgi:hypothetical protein
MVSMMNPYSRIEGQLTVTPPRQHCAQMNQVITWQALRHRTEGQPTAKLVCVVWARYQIEERRERVRCGYRHLAHCGAWWPQVPESYVDPQVPQLTQLE